MRRQVIFFLNGNTAVLDENGNQDGALQNPWLLSFVEHLESYGVDPMACDFMMPDGRVARLFRTSDGRWNWDFA